MSAHSVHDQRRVNVTGIADAPALDDLRYVSDPIRVRHLTVTAARVDNGMWEVVGIDVTGVHLDSVTGDPYTGPNRDARRFYGRDRSHSYQLHDAPEWLRRAARAALLVGPGDAVAEFGEVPV